MLACEICGEEITLEEDMKSHIFVHLKNDIQCPLCSLSVVSYDELCSHINFVHSEEWHGTQDPAHCSSTFGYSAGTSTGVIWSEKPQTASEIVSQSCLTTDSCDTREATSPSAFCVDTEPVQSKQITPLESEASSPEDTVTLTTHSPKRGQESVCNNDNNEMRTEPSKATQKQLLLPSRKEKQFFCPICSLVCSSSFILQEHVELHLQEQRLAEGEERFECPMCSSIFSDIFLLQEHVELHLNHRAAVNSAGSPSSDLKLTRQLQQEEEQRRRHEEARQEREEFKKLQRQFGLDGRGGYFRQMERSMERAVSRGLMSPTEFHCKRAEMMESLASGADDGGTRTQGVVRALYEYYQTESRDCAHVWLSADTDHYCSSVGDKGWGCGYRNLQMLLSSLHRIDAYSPLIQVTSTERGVPSIPKVQSMLEEAWKEGLDPQGASHFNQRLQGTQAWIGATEIFTFLTSLGIRACLIDFHQPTGPGDTHPELFNWVKQYFTQPIKSSRLPPRLSHTSLPPLYLQHQGHSRSIVGLEQKKNGSICLLLLDPGSSASDTRKLLSRDTAQTSIRHVRKFPCSMKHKQYQVVAVQGMLSAEEKQVSILNSRILCAQRIP